MEAEAQSPAHPALHSLAITGMDFVAADCDGLSRFENAIYNGRIFLTGLEEEKVSIGNVPSVDTQLMNTGKGDFAFPPDWFNLSTHQFQILNRSQKLLLRVAAGALRDGGCPASENLARTAIILTDTIYSGDGIPLAYMENWREDFQEALGIDGPIHDYSGDDENLQKAFSTAIRIILSEQAESVLICSVWNSQLGFPGTLDISGGIPPVQYPGSASNNSEINTADGACAILLRDRQDALQERNRIYAVFEVSDQDGIPEVIDDPSLPYGGNPIQIIRNPLVHGWDKPCEPGYVEICTKKSNWWNLISQANFTAEWDGCETHSTALGSLHISFTGVSEIPFLANVIKTALCLYHRFIPAVPATNHPGNGSNMEEGPFYLPVDSRPWLLPEYIPRRLADVYLPMRNMNWLKLRMTDDPLQPERYTKALSEDSLCLIPIAGNDIHEMMDELNSLKQGMFVNESLFQTARERYAKFLNTGTTKYRICLLATNPAEMNKEIDFAVKGLERSFTSGMEWQTPQGSYFSPKPVGKDASTAFVYPGGFNSYIGVGRDLFHLFPDLYQLIKPLTVNPSFLLQERMLYPRRFKALSSEDKARLENELIDNPIAMLNSGTTLSILFSFILRELFGIHPDHCFGYSLGENSMIFATGVWENGDVVSECLNELEIFKTRLSGPQNAVREYWGMDAGNDQDSDAPVWANYLLMCTPEQAADAIKDESRVYLTHINTPRQVVIGGEPQGCQRVINRLKCTHLQAPFHYALHCRAVTSEFESLYRLHNWPVQKSVHTRLYSAAHYGQLKIQQEEIAQALATMLVQPLDFPRLVNEVYKEGARVFIELGAGANCSRWISESLQGKPHLSFSINRKGIDDQSSILRLLARLTSHFVKLNLEPIYNGGYRQTFLPGL